MSDGRAGAQAGSHHSGFDDLLACGTGGLGLLGVHLQAVGALSGQSNSNGDELTVQRVDVAAFATDCSIEGRKLGELLGCEVLQLTKELEVFRGVVVISPESSCFL